MTSPVTLSVTVKLNSRPAKFSKCFFDHISSHHLWPFDLQSNQFVPNCTEVVSLVKIPQVVCKKPCSQTFNMWSQTFGQLQTECLVANCPWMHKRNISQSTQKITLYFVVIITIIIVKYSSKCRLYVTLSQQEDDRMARDGIHRDLESTLSAPLHCMTLTLTLTLAQSFTRRRGCWVPWQCSTRQCTGSCVHLSWYTNGNSSILTNR